LLRFHARVPPHARLPRLGRAARRAEPHVQAGPLGRDGGTDRRRRPRGDRRGRAAARDRGQAARAAGESRRRGQPDPQPRSRSRALGRPGGGAARSRVLSRIYKNLLESQIAQLVMLPCLVGVLTAGAAIGFVELISAVQWLAIGSTALPLHVLPGVPWW